MFHHAITQLAETAELEQRLRLLRLRQLRAGLSGEGSATRTLELDQEAEQILEEVVAKYRSQVWKKWFPPPEEEEPNPMVTRILGSSRECALRSLLMLHQRIMELPVVGCPPAPRGEAGRGMPPPPESRSRFDLPGET